MSESSKIIYQKLWTFSHLRIFWYIVTMLFEIIFYSFLCQTLLVFFIVDILLLTQKILFMGHVCLNIITLYKKYECKNKLFFTMLNNVCFINTILCKKKIILAMKTYAQTLSHFQWPTYLKILLNTCVFQP